MPIPLANRLRLPLIAQYVIFAPLVALFAVACSLFSAPFLAWQFAADCFADIRDAHTQEARAS